MLACTWCGWHGRVRFPDIARRPRQHGLPSRWVVVDISVPSTSRFGPSARPFPESSSGPRERQVLLMRRAIPRLVALLLLSGCLLVGTISEAQILTGSLRGTITDSTGAVLPGVTVELTGPALIGGPKVMTTDTKGQYRFPGLAPGVYVISASLSGFQTVRRENIRVEVGSQFDVDIPLGVGKMEESVTVTAASPLVDTSRSAMTTTVATELVEATHTARFTFFDLAYMTAGVSTARFDNSASRASAFGANVNENQYQFDGVDITAAQTGAAWAWPSTDVVEEVQVIGLGAPAEYGNYQGAVFNVITKSGGNKYTANANFYWQPEALTDTNATLENPDDGNIYGFHRAM